MAGLNLSHVTAEIALTAATKKTIAQVLAPTNQRVKILGWGVSFNGVSVTGVPVPCVLEFQTSAGTGGTSQAPKKTDGSMPETVQSTGLVDIVTTEPTAGDKIDSQDVHPQNGYEKWFPKGYEPVLGGGDRVGIHCTAAAGVSVVGKIFLEE